MNSMQALRNSMLLNLNKKKQVENLKEDADL